MRFASLLAPLALVALAPAACSSKQGASASDGGGLSGTPQNQNPQGIPYPTAHLGTGQRGLDGSGHPQTTPGNVIQNFRFLGYPGGDASAGLQPVQLADYYDPTASKHKLLHIMAGSEWCLPCGQEVDTLLADLKAPATNYAAQGVVYLEALIEGTAENVGSTQGDLDSWVKQHPAPFAQVLDPEAASLGVLFDAAAVPFNADIDVRTMELLQAGTGYEDPSAVAVWIDWVSKNPPSYPLP